VYLAILLGALGLKIEGYSNGKIQSFVKLHDFWIASFWAINDKAE